jgi:AcrR family transcriptional regulator
MSIKRAKAAPRPAETCELRAKVLQASIELIEEEGLAKLSMREVARRAGVTHQAPYHHFADREAILGEIAADGFRMLTERIEQAEHTAGCDASPALWLREMGRAYVEFALQRPAHFRIMFRPELVNPERCPNAKAAGDACFRMVTNIVHAAVDAGVPAQPSEAALVAMLWSLAHGLAGLILDGPLARKQPEVDPAQQIEDVFSALQGMLEASLRCANDGSRPLRASDGTQRVAAARRRLAPRDTDT